jgi:hypothetical protein
MSWGAWCVLKPAVARYLLKLLGIENPHWPLKKLRWSRTISACRNSKTRRPASGIIPEDFIPEAAGNGEMIRFLHKNMLQYRHDIAVGNGKQYEQKKRRYGFTGLRNFSLEQTLRAVSVSAGTG